MTDKEVSELRPGDIIMWFHARPMIFSYGKIDHIGSLHCGIIITGDSAVFDSYPDAEPYAILKVTFKYKLEKIRKIIERKITLSLDL